MRRVALWGVRRCYQLTEIRRPQEARGYTPLNHWLSGAELGAFGWTLFANDISGMLALGGSNNAVWCA